MNRLLQSVYRLRIQSIESLIKLQVPKQNNIKEFPKIDKIPCGILKYENESSVCNKINLTKELNKEERIVNC